MRSNISFCVNGSVEPYIPTLITDPGIYHNSLLGLISLSIDGENWITISDKNLGATVVYNDGDTLSEANCGKYYQRGNNYGFPRTGNITTDNNQVSTEGFGSNYYSDTFITDHFKDGWFTSVNRNLRGGAMSADPRVRRGPCPEGFFVPGKLDLQYLIDVMMLLGISSNKPKLYKKYLKIPDAGMLRIYNGQRNGTETRDCILWSCDYSETSEGQAYVLHIRESVHVTDLYVARGYSIRPFKNIPVHPNQSWIMLYDGSSVATGAGIFHNATEGLISISADGINWITIADKNLGATKVYNYGDTPSEANCGKFYQWGNSYGFPRDGATTTSDIRVDVTNYGPYYNSSTFIIDNSLWSNPNNSNLWGSDVFTNEGIIEATQGPCSTGFHIPTNTDWQNIFDILVTGFGFDQHYAGRALKNYLKMPYAGHIKRNGFISEDRGLTGLYCASIDNYNDANRVFVAYFNDLSFLAQTLRNPTLGCSLRPFKNTSVQPDETWDIIYQPSA